MTRAERDAALSLAAEQYLDLLRLQRTKAVLKYHDEVKALEPKLEAKLLEMTRLRDALISPGPLQLPDYSTPVPDDSSEI